jgi:hypothetical protein
MGWFAGDIFATEKNLTGSQVDKTGNTVDQGGLAGAVGADQSQELALIQGEGDIPQGNPRSVGYAKTADVEGDHTPMFGQNAHQ